MIIFQITRAVIGGENILIGRLTSEPETNIICTRLLGYQRHVLIYLGKLVSIIALLDDSFTTFQLTDGILGSNFFRIRKHNKP